jgi:hypothetical protein
MLMRTQRPEEIALEKGKRRRRGEAEAARSDIIDYVATDSAESAAMRPSISTDETVVGDPSPTDLPIIRRSGLIGGRITLDNEIKGSNVSAKMFTVLQVPWLTGLDPKALHGLLR